MLTADAEELCDLGFGPAGRITAKEWDLNSPIDSAVLARDEKSQPH
jgi:hypothetical protein